MEKNEWIVDLNTMTCWNYANRLVVAFEKRGIGITGKIKHIPMRLVAEWSGRLDRQCLMRKSITEAENVFLRAYEEINANLPN